MLNIKRKTCTVTIFTIPDNGKYFKESEFRHTFENADSALWSLGGILGDLHEEDLLDLFISNSDFYMMMNDFTNKSPKVVQKYQSVGTCTRYRRLANYWIMKEMYIKVGYNMRIRIQISYFLDK